MSGGVDVWVRGWLGVLMAGCVGARGRVEVWMSGCVMRGGWMRGCDDVCDVRVVCGGVGVWGQCGGVAVWGCVGVCGGVCGCVGVCWGCVGVCGGVWGCVGVWGVGVWGG